MSGDRGNTGSLCSSRPGAAGGGGGLVVSVCRLVLTRLLPLTPTNLSFVTHAAASASMLSSVTVYGRSVIPSLRAGEIARKGWGRAGNTSVFGRVPVTVPPPLCPCTRLRVGSLPQRNA